MVDPLTDDRQEHLQTNVPADDAHGDVEDNVESRKSRQVETHDKDHQSI